MLRLAPLLLAALAAGCAAPPPDGAAEPKGGVEVVQPDEGLLRVAWAPPFATRVEIRHAETGALVWRASAGATRDPMAGVLGSPLGVHRFGMPLDVFPPDGRGAEASQPERMVRGERYVVTVEACVPAADGACAPTSARTGAFTARRTVEPPPFR